MPCELTELEPEYRPVAWKDPPLSREDGRPVHPAVAAEAERHDAIHRPTEEDCSRPFSPSPLLCFRTGWSLGGVAEQIRANKAWVGVEHSVLYKAIRREGADYARGLLDRVVAQIVAEDEAAS